MTPSEPLTVVVGPTASGKTALAVKLCAQQNGEVVSADSVQVYRDFNIGAGKPSAEELERAPHHLLSVVNPLQDMDAARWVELADRAVAEIRARGKRPIVCGGTFLWVRAFIYGLAPAPPADDAIRQNHRDFAEQFGRAALHALLRPLDPVLHAKLDPNDFVRVSRALEVHELTQRPLSAWHAEHGFRTPRFPTRLIGVGWEKEALSARIAERVRQMFERGWIDEVRDLLAAGYVDARPMGAVGYRQIADWLRTDPRSSEEELIDRVTRSTRVFARRQRTWLRDEPVTWLPPEALDTESG